MISTAATIALSARITTTQPYGKTYTEAHVLGCKASNRRVDRVDSQVRESAFSVADLIKMQANPDEGTYKIHACLSPVVAAAKKG